MQRPAMIKFFAFWPSGNHRAASIHTIEATGRATGVRKIVQRSSQRALHQCSF
jgi:hypothetical protein